MGGEEQDQDAAVLCHKKNSIFVAPRWTSRRGTRLSYLCIDRYINFKVNRVSSKWKSQLYRNKRWEGTGTGGGGGLAKRMVRETAVLAFCHCSLGVGGCQDESCKEYLVLFP